MTYPPGGQQQGGQDPAQTKMLHDQAAQVCEVVLRHLLMALARFPDDPTYERRQVLRQLLEGVWASDLGAVHARVLRIIQQTSFDHGRHMSTPPGVLMPPAVSEALVQRRTHEWVRNCLESIRHYLDEIHAVVSDPNAYNHTMLAFQNGGGFKALTLACGVPIANDDIYYSLSQEFAKIIPHPDTLALKQLREEHPELFPKQQ